MRTDLCIAQSDVEMLRQELLNDAVECCAVLLVAPSTGIEGKTRLLVREILLPNQKDYTKQSDIGAELHPHFVAQIAKRARNNQLSVVFVHTHLQDGVPDFSATDDEGEQKLSSFLVSRGVKGHNSALVISKSGMRARLLGTQTELRVISIGSKRRIEFDPDSDDTTTSVIFDRQVRAFGEYGQKNLEKLTVAIVGLGGTGSLMAQQLVHLGIRKFILIDHDSIDETNLNRIVGANFADIGVNKGEVAARYVCGFNKNVKAKVVAGDVTRDSIAYQLVEADVIMCCTDSHGSRSVIQQVVYQHLIPCIDMGSVITQDVSSITGIFGRVQLLSPSLPCLWCSAILDAQLIRCDMMSEAERKLDPYIIGGHEPAPSVISLNSTVVSLSVTMLLGVVVDAPIDATCIIYNAISPSLRSVQSEPKPNCFICSRNGVMARGDLNRFFTRMD